MVKRCSTVIIRKMQMKTTKSLPLTLVRTAIIKRTSTNKRWQGCGEKGILMHCWVLPWWLSW